MEGIRLATETEVEAIRKEADLGPGTSVVALGNIVAVMRNCVELDPVFYNDATASKKAMFIWGIENCLRFTNVPEYYFNIPASDEFAEYRETVTKWGAEQVSKGPELRFKKVL